MRWHLSRNKSNNFVQKVTIIAVLNFALETLRIFAYFPHHALESGSNGAKEKYRIANNGTGITHVLQPSKTVRIKQNFNRINTWVPVESKNLDYNYPVCYPISVLVCHNISLHRSEMIPDKYEKTTDWYWKWKQTHSTDQIMGLHAIGLGHPKQISFSLIVLPRF